MMRWLRPLLVLGAHRNMLPHLVQRSMQMRLTDQVAMAQIRLISDGGSKESNQAVAPHSDHSVDPADIVKNTPYFAKYADKLEGLKKRDPTLYAEKMQELTAHHQKIAEEKRKERQQQHDQAVSAYTKKKTLDGIMKQELLLDKSAEEIEQIWMEFHNTKGCIFAVIPKNEYEEIHKRSLENPMFVYPVPRGAGYEFFLQRWDGQDCHFTSLIMYQQHKENAPPCLTLTHYTELMHDKGIVLMRGEPDTKLLSVHEAQLLALQVKLYYGVQSGLKFNLVRLFTNSPEDFRYMDIVREFENYKKDYVEHMIEKV